MNKKALKTSLAGLALVGAIGVGSTLAYMTSQSNDLTNTFTVGDGYPDIPGYEKAVLLHETDITKQCTVNDKENCFGDRTLKGNAYTKVMPGDILTKDPKVTVGAGSVDSYIFAYVTGLDALKNEGITAEINDEWKKADTNKNSLDGLYIYSKNNNEVIKIGDTNCTTEALFSNLKVDGTATLPETLNNVEVKAVAVQGVYKDGGKDAVVDRNAAIEDANKALGLNN